MAELSPTAAPAALVLSTASAAVVPGIVATSRLVTCHCPSRPSPCAAAPQRRGQRTGSARIGWGLLNATRRPASQLATRKLFEIDCKLLAASSCQPRERTQRAPLRAKQTRRSGAMEGDGGRQSPAPRPARSPPSPGRLAPPPRTPPRRPPGARRLCPAQAGGRAVNVLCTHKCTAQCRPSWSRRTWPST